MQIRAVILDNLAKMICGDEPYLMFPYRSSWFLTQFFQNLGIDFTHSGEWRAKWVRDKLGELNQDDPENPLLPSPRMKSVIESILDLDYFDRPTKDAQPPDHPASFEKLKEILGRQDLGIEFDRRRGVAHILTNQADSSSEPVSTEEDGRAITIAPSVFSIPRTGTHPMRVAVMMPFSAEFDPVLGAITDAALACEMSCLRADDMWNNATFVQDIFELIFTSRIIVVDFSGKNPNVMYETGIAHTLGKEVIPIARTMQDVPSDLRHHRALVYHPNEQGYRDLEAGLIPRIRKILET